MSRKVRARWLLIIMAAGGLLLAACTWPGLEPSPAATLTSQPRPTSPVSGTPAASPFRPELPLYRDPAQPVEVRVADLLSRMTLDEKIGQMALVERSAISDPRDIATFGLGGILSGGGSVPTPNTPSAWADMVDGFQRAALSSRLGIPILYGVDAVHGHNNVVGATIFPHNIGLGATRNPALVQKVAQITAREVYATGIRWTFSPCLCVGRDERWGRTYECFGEDPEVVSMMAGPAVRGYQGPDLSAPNAILATAKHWVADGGTQGGVDRGDAVLSEEELRRVHIPPYVEAIRAGVGSVMASFSSWNGTKMHGNPYLLTTVLKEELGFRGFLVSDWGAIDQLPGDYASDVRTAINAGIDMVMVPYDYQQFLQTLRAEVQAGRIRQERIDDAVSRILIQKFALGLFERPLADRSGIGDIGSPAHREVARQAVRESLVLLKNEGNILPISPNRKNILVAGSNGDDIGSQCGGWTITWQGERGDITPGTTIYQGIKNLAPPGTQVTYARQPVSLSGYDLGIVVIGERPYAEWYGDDADLEISPEDAAAVQQVCDAMPCVVILISGRPMIINTQLAQADALIAAWLPGTEGDGVAEVLFGRYDFTGKLPVSWPRSIDQLPLNVGDAGYDPLFPYGFGLSYSSSSTGP
ncbi:MAG: glycoside hydrolase family 3 N-terminal domain-containing protein [Anaerolineae bacterium]|nr:glycoside hydrolase family 3 C-terminal domain-containing protein [Anaerolineae bacterium]MDW8068202.1 glycoside hydrolase family 3 N-terminal domain-containing protein [Anaerolineae bacterium]